MQDVETKEPTNIGHDLSTPPSALAPDAKSLAEPLAAPQSQDPAQDLRGRKRRRGEDNDGAEEGEEEEEGCRPLKKSVPAVPNSVAGDGKQSPGVVSGPQSAAPQSQDMAEDLRGRKRRRGEDNDGAEEDEEEEEGCPPLKKSVPAVPNNVAGDATCVPELTTTDGTGPSQPPTQDASLNDQAGDRPHGRPRHLNPGGLLCYNCWSRTHMVDHCPHPLFCSKCGGDNHTAQVCAVTKQGQQPIGSCYNCNATDHSVKNCPHSLFCTFCERPGHTRNVCWREDPARKDQHSARKEKQPPPAAVPTEAVTDEAVAVGEVDILSVLRTHKGGKKQKAADDFMDQLRRYCEQLQSAPPAPPPVAEGPEAAVDPAEPAASEGPPGPRKARCYNCKSAGHVVRDCPDKLFCTRCRKEGHTANRCKTCHNCGGHHLLRECPKPVVCSKCKKSGHTVNKCKQQVEGEAPPGRPGATVKGFAAEATAETMLQILQETGFLPAGAEVTPVLDPTPLCVVLCPTTEERDAFVTALNGAVPALCPPLVAHVAAAEEVAALLGSPASPPPPDEAADLAPTAHPIAHPAALAPLPPSDVDADPPRPPLEDPFSSAEETPGGGSSGGGPAGEEGEAPYW